MSIDAITIKPRVRFAPSPTGPLHVGGARAALFNYLFAKKYEGTFVLRIEDTDLERSDPKFEKDILDNLQWLGIQWNEGPVPFREKEAEKTANLNLSIDQAKNYAGEFGPYRQSERLASYAKYLDKLLQEDKAYHCFCSEEELEAKRQYQLSDGKPAIYDGKCGNLSKEEADRYLAEGKSSIIRFRSPVKKVIFHDLIRGKVEFDSALIGDFSIAKNLTAPLYNFAVVIDDFEMEISHVIRGEDHISNTPKQILLQETLEFPQPKYAHLPLILGWDRSKLSKRNENVGVSEYRKEGYLPEALVNFMAFLGWNPGTEKEIFSLPALVKEFSLERVRKGGAVFNIKKLDYINGFYIRQKPLERLAELCFPFLQEAGLIKKETANMEDLQQIISLYRERLRKLSEIVELTDFFFKDVLEYNKELLKWRGAAEKETKEVLNKLEKLLSGIKAEDFNRANLERVLMPEAERAGLPADLSSVARGTKEEAQGAKAGDRGYLLWPLRVALTGKEASAGPFEIAEILGKEKTLQRMEKAKMLID